MLSLRAAESELAAGRMGVEGEAELLGEILPEWPRLQEAIEEIVERCEAAMSPGPLFDQEPLSGLPRVDATWMKPLVVALWKSRNRFDEAVAECAVALREADEACAQLKSGWSSMTVDERRKGLRSFCEACGGVSKALSALPSGYRGI